MHGLKVGWLAWIECGLHAWIDGEVLWIFYFYTLFLYATYFMPGARYPTLNTCKTNQPHICWQLYLMLIFVYYILCRG